MNQHQGFTLIEILVALTIFAILSALTSGVLYQTFNTQSRINNQNTERLALQKIRALMQNETLQITQRATRGPEMRLYPALSGHEHYVEFTTLGTEQKRIAWLCRGNQLIHRRFSVLDAPNRHQYQDTLLMNQLSQCSFAFLSAKNSFETEWTSAPMTNKDPALLPKAIQLRLTLKHGTDFDVLFPIPAG